MHEGVQWKSQDLGSDTVGNRQVAPWTIGVQAIRVGRHEMDSGSDSSLSEVVDERRPPAVMDPHPVNERRDFGVGARRGRNPRDIRETLLVKTAIRASIGYELIDAVE